MATLSSYIHKLQKRGMRSFTLQEAMSFLQSHPKTIASAIHRLKEKGVLISPARGLYVIIPPEYQNTGSILPEELLPIIARYLGIDYYVSHLSAARHYGASHQRPNCFQVVSSYRITTLS